MSLTIDDLLGSLQNPNKKKTLPNNRQTWEAIGNRDFEALGFTSEVAMDEFLVDWLADNNDYNNI